MKTSKQKNQTVKRSKFAQLISANGDNVLQTRADNLALTADIAQQTLINDLKNEKARLELELMQLTDLAPTNKMDLTPNSKDWDPNKWVSEVQSIKQSLYQLNIQLKIAEDTYKEFFKI